MGFDTTYEREDRSNLPLPYPRLGKRAFPLRPYSQDLEDEAGQLQQHQQYVIPQLLPMARIGRRTPEEPFEAGIAEIAGTGSDLDATDDLVRRLMMKRGRVGGREVIIPMARIGRRSGATDKTPAYHIPMPRIG